MLFNPKVTTETEKTLEDLLFQDEEEETPRLPKTSVESFQGSVTTTVSSSSEKKPTEKSVEIQATFNVTEAEYQLMNDEPFEYIESNVEEDAKYLESAIGLPEYDQGIILSSHIICQDTVCSPKFFVSEPLEANEVYNEDATDFDELLARTQGSKEKNPRSLEFDGYNHSSPTNKGVSWLLLLFMVLSPIISIFHL